MTSSASRNGSRATRRRHTRSPISAAPTRQRSRSTKQGSAHLLTTLMDHSAAQRPLAWQAPRNIQLIAPPISPRDCAHSTSEIVKPRARAVVSAFESIVMASRSSPNQPPHARCSSSATSMTGIQSRPHLPRAVTVCVWRQPSRFLSDDMPIASSVMDSK